MSLTIDRLRVLPARERIGVALGALVMLVSPGRAADTLLRAAENVVQRQAVVGLFDTVIPQVVDGAGWKTSFFFTNLTSQTAYFVIYFSDNNGNLMRLPLNGYGSTMRLSGAIPPNSSIEFETPGTSQNLIGGSAQIFTLDKPVDDPTARAVMNKLGGIAIFRQRVAGRPDFEAVVPVSPTFENTFRLFFDNRSGYSSGVAIVNGGPDPVTVSMIARDMNGGQILMDSFPLASSQKLVFSVHERYPALRERSGILQFSSSRDSLSGLGLRFNPGGAFTSIHTLSGPE